MTRPVGIAPGWPALVAAWIAALVISQLTGAAAVVILLALATVAAIATGLMGWWAVGRSPVPSVRLPPLVTAGETVRARIDGVDNQRVDVSFPSLRSTELGVDRSTAPASAPDASRTVDVVFPRRGLVDSVVVDLRSAGPAGIVWWRRRMTVDVEPVLVAPAPAGSGARIELRPTSGRPSESAGEGPGPGVSGAIRPWHDGDSERSIHWPTTVRAGELMVHDERERLPGRRVVRARSGTPDPDAEAGRVRRALDDALRSGESTWAAVDDEPAMLVEGRVAAARWTATVDLGPAGSADDDGTSGGMSRFAALRELARLEVSEAFGAARARWVSHSRAIESPTLSVSARWWVAAATATALTTLVGALGWGAVALVTVLAGIAGGALISVRLARAGSRTSKLSRAAIAAVAVVGLVAVGVRSGDVSGIFGIIRGPMPELLIVLVLLHGVECFDRRTARVHLAISGVLLAYAAGLRVDADVIVWMVGWCVLAALAAAAIGRSGRSGTAGAWGSTARSALIAAVAGAGTLAVLAVVPIPDGPVQLALPSLIEQIRSINEAGALARPDGVLVQRDDEWGASRGLAGQPGAYTGFAERFDTSVRGELSDALVMRVRAPEPAFWRGQTFAEFDGRFWFADDDVGELREAGGVVVSPTLGDVRTRARVDRLVQTFYAEVDLSNIVFAAYRPVRVTLDGPMWTRPDGALRAGVVVTAGSIYTVESARVQVTEASLQAQGDIGARLSDRGREAFARYLDVPASTSQRTLDLAAELRGPTTYDTVRSYEAWIAANVTYDLFAPVPPPGRDAVDDLLFESQRGFCEQIASALTVMLRSQGVPARLATGYLPGERNPFTGVWEVLASDAHAWVEVWFPETGWEPFDPTADVPLAGDVDRSTVGGELLGSLVAIVGGRLPFVALAAAGLAAVALLRVLLVRVVARRRRGRWGLLQDRFTAAARSAGIDVRCSNPEIARRWADVDPRSALVAHDVASTLDQVAFDPGWDREGTEAVRRRDEVDRALRVLSANR